MAHLFRNLKITGLNMVAQEGSGTVLRLHVRSEVMPDFVDAMSWTGAFPDGSLAAGIASVNLTGVLALSQASFAPNGMKEYNLKVPASEARDFTASVAKGKKGKPPETYLDFIITFPKPSIKKLAIDYYLNVGSGDAVLYLTESGKEGELDFGESEQPPLASVSDMKKKGKKGEVN